MEISYKTVFIPKKNNKLRKLEVPNNELKEKQREILEKLYEFYNYGDSYYLSFAYGFIPNMGIYDNARVHKNKKYILNIDIKDFFPSCRLRSTEAIKSLERKKPQLFEDIKKFAFYNGHLPQGAPTSPFVSNLIAHEIDIILIDLLRTTISDDIMYSRYADDITISSNSKAIFSYTCLNIIKRVLRSYDFKINKEKIRKLTPSQRLEVTGLCLNSGNPTVSRKKRRLVKAMIHNAAKKGQITKEEFNKINGLLSFIVVVPKHKEWVRQQRQKLINVPIVEA